MKHSRILIAVALPLLAILALASCNDNQNKIPFDRAKAKQHIISWELGDTMRNSFISGLDSLDTLLSKDSSMFLQGFRLPVAEMFNRDAIIALLDAEGAEYVRVYMGRDTRDSGKIKLVLIPADKNGKDIKTNLLSGKKPATQRAAGQADDPDGDLDGDDGGYQVIEVGQRCPTICD